MNHLTLIVVGSGGTGSYFLKEFSRFYQGRNDFFKDMFVIDGDTVEEKNLMRQSFLEEDIGFNKASVLTGVLNDAFGLEWRAIGKYVSSSDEILSLVDRNCIPVIIGCVDNHACRMVLEEVFEKSDSCIYIDSANEFTSGEVVFAAKDRGRILGPVRSEYFPEIKDGEMKSRLEISCEELNNAAPQHIATNMMAGNIILSSVCRLLSSDYKCGVCYFDTASFSCDFVEREVTGSDAA